ncbi:MAG: ribosomal protein S21e-domain-containing protein [Monoraphidium minutum]|nr:MAG: ribosomal protein S21e-domain-containing protein [Monoraphidium minutum]
MKNDEGEVVDLYIPRKCAWTNKLITAKDHASVQINIGNVDTNGLFSNTFTTYAFSGAVRQRVRRRGAAVACAGARGRARWLPPLRGRGSCACCALALRACRMAHGTAPGSSDMPCMRAAQAQP